jgi:hypothetical protein
MLCEEYLQRQSVKYKLVFSQPFIGWLAVIGSITGMAGAVIYARVCKTLPLGPLLARGRLPGVVRTFQYL